MGAIARIRQPKGLAARLLAGQLIVMIAGAVTAGLVAAFVGPLIFHDHLLQAGEQSDPAAFAHIEMAYLDASLLSLGLGLLISLVAATLVTLYLTGRIGRSLGSLAVVAGELSRGHYEARVPDAGTGTELDMLAGAMNDMAGRLESTEQTRRRMLSDLAHELRTPIATLTAYHDALHDGIAVLGPESEEVLADQTGRLARLADDLDEVSTAEEGRIALDIRAEDVVDLVRTVAEAAEAKFVEAGVRLVTDSGAAAGVLVAVDRQRIGQVLDNLLSNALRHTPSGGTVELSARPDGGEAVIVVTDSGEGMAADDLGHIFERFYRADRSRTRGRNGSGIGLTISRAIVDAHGGTITAASPGVGQGSTFTVRLPLLAG